MIQIKGQHISDVCSQFADAILLYVQGIKNGKQLNKVRNLISRYFPNEDFRSLLVASPQKLSELVRSWEALPTKNAEDFTYFKTLYSYLNVRNKYVIPDSSSSSLSHYMLEKIGSTVCPYCNRNFIYNVKDRRTSELDHYYSISTHPFLAISFYNLIPSCKVCNHIKNDDSREVLHPYNTIYDFDSIKFQFIFRTYSGTYDPNGLTLFLTSSSNSTDTVDKLNVHKEVLPIMELYERHKDIVVELIQKRQMYTEEYLHDLKKRLNSKGISVSENDFYLLITGNYVENGKLDKRPLAKLNLDICKQLGFVPRCEL